MTRNRPNLVFVFPDEMRAQATGYAGDPNAKTPNLDRFAGESVWMRNAVSCCPVCTPYRASLMTGQYPLTHGLIVNDIPLQPKGTCLAEALAGGGYRTAYIGKWHIDGHGRSAFVPPERRLGFQYWRGFECNHEYWDSHYYADTPEKRKWEGYDAFAQTRMAQDYIRKHDGEAPFALFLSWGPPHTPHDSAPPEFRRLYDPASLELPPNIPEADEERAREDLCGYYAHISALDHAFGELLQTLNECGLEEETIVVFTSDHGDMCGAHGHYRKQRPWDESALVPFLARIPGMPERAGTRIDTPFNAPDVMPTLLGLCGVEIPESAEGLDFSGTLRGEESLEVEGAYMALYITFHQWAPHNGGKIWRGVRTERHTYVRDLEGPWLLHDNETDPYQMKNLCNDPAHADLQKRLDAMLERMLRERNDPFGTRQEMLDIYGIATDAQGRIPVSE